MRFGWMAVVVLLAFPAWAAAPAYTLVKEKSSVKFYAIAKGKSLEGQFTDFSAQLRFDREKLEESSIKAEVNIASVQTGDAEVQKNITLPEWLNAKKFATASFVSTKINRMPGSENYFAEGKLSLHGKTLPVTVNFQLKHYGDTEIAEGFLTLRRDEFGVGQGEWAKDDTVKNAVRVEFRIVAEKQ